MLNAEFLTRFQAAERLGKNRRTLIDNEARWGLQPISLNGHISYTRENVDAVAARWRALAAPSTVPAGWHLLIANAKGPFIGEDVPMAPALARMLGKSEDIEKLGGVERKRRCLVSLRTLSEAFKVAEAEGLNIISNGRGIVAVKEA